MRWAMLAVLSCFLLPGACSAPAEEAGVPANAAKGSSVEAPIKEKEIIDALIEGLDDADSEVRQNVANALANLGERAVPQLITALSHAKMERRAGAAHALALVRPAPHQAVPALLKALKDDHELVRRQVSYALSRIVGRDRSSETNELRPDVPPPDPPPGLTSPGGPR